MESKARQRALEMAAILCRDNEGESEWMSGLNLLGDHHAISPYEALRWLKRIGSG